MPFLHASSPASSSPGRWPALLALLGLFLGWSGLSGCASTIDDKRVLQYLNQKGFGKRYYGNAQEQNYVSIGDTIRITDTFNDEIRGTFVVDIDGTILLPEVGALWVAGYTRSELESYLTQKLSPFFVETDVKVDIHAGGKKVFFVMGEVSRPGPQPYTGDITIYEAVMAARPSEYGANLGRVRIIRADPKDPVIIPVDVPKLWTLGDSTYNIQVQEYDIIYVPPTFMQGVANTVSALLVPAISVFRDVFQAIFFLDNPEFFFRGRRNNFF